MVITSAGANPAAPSGGPAGDPARAPGPVPAGAAARPGSAPSDPAAGPGASRRKVPRPTSREARKRRDKEYERRFEDFGQRLAWFDQGAGGDESCELVAGEESFFHGGVARYAGVLGVGHDGAADFVGVAAFFQDFVAFVGMFFRGGIFLVIEIMDQSDDSPKILILAKLFGVGAHAGFDGEGMFAQTF